MDLFCRCLKPVAEREATKEREFCKTALEAINGALVKRVAELPLDETSKGVCLLR